LWRSSLWPINTEAFNNQPITEWIVPILNPNKVLNVPRVDSRKFQLHAAITLDHIWFVRNQLVHNEVQPLIPQFTQKISSTIRAHTLAWEDATSHSLWSLPLLGSFKANFDVAVRADLAVAAMVINYHADDIIYATTKRIFMQDAAVGEALAALLATHAASLYGVYNLILERYAINIILLFKIQVCL
jgi:dihydroorotase